MDHTLLLRKALFVNAAFSTACGLSLLVAPAAVARRIGFGEPAALWQLGVSLLVFAAFLTLTARARRLRAWVAGIFTLMDVLPRATTLMTLPSDSPPLRRRPWPRSTAGCAGWISKGRKNRQTSRAPRGIIVIDSSW